jgi:hypothetical protein
LSGNTARIKEVRTAAGISRRTVECAQAKISRNTKITETAKASVFTAAAVTTAIMAMIPYPDPVSAAAATATCAGIGIAVPAAALVTDLAVGAANGNFASAAMGSLGSVFGMAANMDKMKCNAFAGR